MAVVAEKTAKAKRRGWTQAQVAELVRSHTSGVMVSHDLLPFSGDERVAKLVELGLVAKPSKPTLEDHNKVKPMNLVGDLEKLPEPQRTLAVRYAIRSLQALLPKRSVAK